MEVRIQKYLSDCGVMSRRTAEKEILLGKVLVNGKPAKIGQKIDPDRDTVEYKGKTIKKETQRYTYIMLNKPIGYVTTMSDEKGRKCVADLVKDVGVRVYPVGRLDLNSEGLLLMTNDGELTELLTHPKHRIKKVYHVKIDSEITPEQLKELSSSMEIDGYTIQPVKTTVLKMAEGKTVLQMELYEGRNRQIRKMCEKVGLEIINLKRVAIGEIKLGNLGKGRWRYLTKSQVEYLKNQAKKEGKVK